MKSNFTHIKSTNFRVIAKATLAFFLCVICLQTAAQVVAVEDEIFTYDNVYATGDLSSNDINPGNGPLIYTLLSNTSDGVLIVDTDGSWTFSPYPDASAVNDTLYYQVCDDLGNCDVGAIAFYIQFQNNPPEPENDYLIVEMNESRFGDVSSNDFDPDYLTDPISGENNYNNITLPSHGTIIFNLDGTFQYTPDSGYTGSDTFSYINCDACTICAPADVFITVIGTNEDPVATNSDVISINEDNSFTGTAASLVTDPESDPLTFTVLNQPQHGLVVMNSDGGYFYSPDPDYFGNDQFNFIACDIVGQCSLGNIYFNVLAQNDPPNVVGEFITAVEDTPFISGNVSINDTDDEPGLIYSQLSPPENGTVILQSNGAFTYFPALNYSGLDTFLIQVCDAENLCITNTTIFNLTPVNDPPTIVEDELFGYEDQIYNGSVANDIDPDGDVMTYQLVSNGPGASISMSINGDISVSPNLNFSGFINITYEACDTGGACSTGSFAFEVIEINDDPIINPDIVTGSEDQIVNGNIRPNDIEPDGELIFYFNTTNPIHGTLLLNSDGTFTYTPDPNWFGTEVINFYGCDPCSVCMLSTLTIVINPANDSPVLTAGSGIVDEDNSLTSILTSLGTDIDGDILTYSLILLADHGIASIAPNGTLTYQPTSDYHGQDSFTFAVCDNSGICDTSNFSITVNPVNDSPVAFPDESFTAEDTPVNGNVNNDSDVDDITLNFSVITPPMNGFISMNSNGEYTYTPDDNFNGVDMITYNVCDNSLECDAGVLVVNISPLNDPPSAQNDFNVTYQNSSLSGSVASNDSDIDGDNVEYSQLIGPLHGTFNMNLDGTYEYFPDINYFGSDEVSYEVCDPSGECTSAYLFLTVFMTNTSPIASDFSISTNEDVLIADDLSDYVSDEQGGNLVFEILIAPTHGILQLLANGTFSYEPAANFSGSDSFSYEVCDTGNMCDEAIVSITVNDVNDIPDVLDEFVEILEDNGVSFDLAENDSDQEESALTYSIVFNATHGIIDLTTDGFVMYTPDANYFGTETITYSVCDESNACSEGIFTINILPVNDIPLVIEDSFDINEDDILTGTLNSNDTDIESSELTYSASNVPSGGTLILSNNGNFTFTPVSDFHGIFTFDYTACDDGGLCATSTATITIYSVNDIPFASNDQRTINEDNAASGNLSLNDTDSDGDQLTYTILTNTTNGNFELSVDGSFTYTANPDYFGSDFALISVCDNADECVESEFNVTILPVNDSPAVESEDFTTDEDQLVSGNLSTNDTDVDGDILTYSISNTPLLGTLEIDPDGNFIYVPDENIYGSEVIFYDACDNSGACEEGSVTFTITPVNDVPIVVGEYQHVLEDSEHSDDLSLNDYDIDIEPLTYEIIAGPYHGEFILTNSVYLYIPDQDYWGPDSVTYVACDPSNICAQANIVFEVDFVNDPPIVSGEIIQVLINETVTGSVALNEVELDNETLVYFIYNDDSNGIFTLFEDGTYTYTPNENVTGIFELEYYACDPCSVCGSGIITINVVNIKDANNPPSATSFQTSICQGSSIDVDMTTLITDPDEDVYSLQITFGEITSGEILLDPETRILTFTDDAENIEDIIIPYTVCDNGLVQMCDSDSIIISIGDVIHPTIDSFEIVDVDCFDNSSGSIDLIDIIGSGNLSYLWDTNAETQDLENLSAGEYSVMITSDAPCSLPQTFHFTVVGPLSALSGSILNQSNISDSNEGMIDIEITGGTPPYDVSWNGPDGYSSSNEDLSGLTLDGDYFAIITDSNNCEITLNTGITGIKETRQSFNASVLPNPFNEEFTLQLNNTYSGNVIMDIIDAQGRIIYHSNIYSATTKINPGVIASGCYQMRLISEEEIHIISLIKN